jgi:hypothetical protein
VAKTGKFFLRKIRGVGCLWIGRGRLNWSSFCSQLLGQKARSEVPNIEREINLVGFVQGFCGSFAAHAFFF